MEEGNHRILIIDDDENIREMMKWVLTSFGEVGEARTGKEAREKFQTNEYDIILLDYLLPDTDGITLLKEFKEQQPLSEFILITMVREINIAVKAIKAGAFDYIHKDFEVEDLKALIIRVIEKLKRNQEILFLRSEVERLTEQEFILGHSPKMAGFQEILGRAASTPATVLIQGESGTGKELVARYLHNHSKRVNKPFVAVNMASIPDNLVESTLFGHEKGSFTGAIRKSFGKFELADGGTLFCDEIADLKLELQSKLLRVIQESEFERIGGGKPIHVDVRIITATNRDLKEMVQEGSFREDLYYRLNVIPIYLPPLRERIEDIPLFVNLFLRRYNRKYGRNISLGPDSLAILANYDWPGNIRELENLMARLVAINPSPVIRPEDIPIEYQLHEVRLQGNHENRGGSLKDATEAFERGYILRVLEKEGWHQENAAFRLGIHRKTLEYKLKKLNLTQVVQKRQREYRQTQKMSEF